MFFSLHAGALEMDAGFSFSTDRSRGPGREKDDWKKDSSALFIKRKMGEKILELAALRCLQCYFHLFAIHQSFFFLLVLSF